MSQSTVAFFDLLRPEARIIKECLRKLRDRNPKTFVIEEVSKLHVSQTDIHKVAILGRRTRLIVLIQDFNYD